MFEVKNGRYCELILNFGFVFYFGYDLISIIFNVLCCIYLYVNYIF